MPDPPRYRFGPLERRGLVAGWRGGQIVAVAVGLLVGVFVLRARPDVAGAVMAAVAVAGGVAVACWPVAGRTPEEWAPTLVRWGMSGVMGGRRQRAAAPELGHCAGPDGVEACPTVHGAGGPMAVRPRRVRAGARIPARSGEDDCFGTLQLLGVPLRGGTVGSVAPAAAAAHREGLDAEGSVAVVADRRARTYTGVLSVRGHSFALLGQPDKERRVAAWASVLASLAREGSLVHRLQWTAMVQPDDGRAVRRHLDEQALLPESSPARRSYADLLLSAGASTCRHEVLVAVQVQMGRATARSLRAAGGGDAGAASLAVREMETLRRLLSDADVMVDGFLGPRALAEVVRRSTDAGAASGAGGAAADRRTCPPCLVGWPWPLATESAWDRLRTDDTWHATYWVAEWPRVDVGSDFLAPLLLGPVRRAVSVVMEPVPPSRAVRQVEQARTADIADSELRRRGGFLATARRSREAEVVAQREAELADGHASFRFSGYVTVTAASPALLDEACEATEQAAGQARLELRRLFGDQRWSFTCTLPLCRGLS